MNDILRIADFCSSTKAFGPQTACVLWLQGCSKTCAGCVAPMWRKFAGGEMRTIQEVLNWITGANVTNLVVSGGEPLDQSTPLLSLMKMLSDCDMGKILYTGYTFEEIDCNHQYREVVNCFDTLVCGPYIEKLNDSRGLRGSSNQEIIFQTSRHEHFKDVFLYGKRQLELEIYPEFTRMIGIPPAGFPLDFRF